MWVLWYCIKHTRFVQHPPYVFAILYQYLLPLLALMLTERHNPLCTLHTLVAVVSTIPVSHTVGFVGAPVHVALHHRRVVLHLIYKIYFIATHTHTVIHSHISTMSDVEQLITTIEETMQDLLETMNPEYEAIYDKLADAVNTYREAILNKLGEDIEDATSN